jgi:hypothetical protein
VDEALPLHTLLDVLYKHSLEWPDLRIWHVDYSIYISINFSVERKLTFIFTIRYDCMEPRNAKIHAILIDFLTRSNLSARVEPVRLAVLT